MASSIFQFGVGNNQWWEREAAQGELKPTPDVLLSYSEN